MSASLFGTGSPQIVGTGTPDSATRTLDFAILKPTWVNSVLKEFVSILDGERHYIKPHHYSEFDIELLVYKETDSRTAFLTIYDYLFQEVYFKPYEHDDDLEASDGKTIKNESGSNAIFTITNMQPGLIEPNTEFDVYILTLKSNVYTDLQQTY